MMFDFVYDKPAVGMRIQEKRLALGFTQEKLAERLGKSLRLVTEIERGMVGMSIETLLDMCAALKATPNDLLLPRQKTPATELAWLVEALSNTSEP